MRVFLSCVAGGLLALGSLGAAFAAEEAAKPQLTLAHSWTIGQERLVEVFSRGLGVELGAEEVLAVQVARERVVVAEVKCGP